MALHFNESEFTARRERLIARMAADKLDAISVIRTGRNISAVLHSVAAELGHAFDDWKRRYASVCMSDDPGSTTLAERADVIRELLLADPEVARARIDVVPSERAKLTDRWLVPS